MESWIDSTRLRCGPLAEAANRFAASEGFEPDPPRGLDALLSLARAIDRQRHKRDADEDSDRLFIEGAGAFLAATLADTLQAGQHIHRGQRHRLRLGRFGCFDPFASIELALTADSVKRCLSEQIAQAEAYAGESATLSLLAAEAVRQLEQRYGAVAIIDCFETELVLELAGERVTLSLSTAVELCEAEGQNVEAAVRRLLSGALPAGASSFEHEWSSLRAGLLPRLLSSRFLSGLPARHDLLTHRLAEGVELGFIVRSPARARYLRRRELAGRPAGHALAHALRNLAARSGQARLWHLQTDDGPLVTAHSGDGLDSSRILLPGLHDLLAAELGSPFLVAVPHRDALHAAPRGDVSRRALSARAQQEAARARYPITDRLFEVHPGARLRPVGG